MNEYKTIKQIADELKVSKQRVYRYIRKKCISEARHDALRDTGVKHYDEAAQRLIIKHFKSETVSGDVHREPHQTVSDYAVSDTVVLMLKNELEIKNKQIDDLTTALLETSKALHAAQTLHAGTMKTHLIESVGDEISLETEKKTSRVSRFFQKFR